MTTLSLIIIPLALICGVLILWRVPTIPPGNDKKEPAKTVSLIIPAYNEENRLPALLDSLNRQDYRPQQIIVVDDHSQDKTSEIARAQGATVITSLNVSEGWIGKSRACWSGALKAQGEIFVFLDADVYFTKRDSLRRLIRTYEKLGSSGILSVQPYHEIRKPYEHLSAIFNLIVMAGMNVFTPLQDKIKSAGSFGPCIVCAQKEYFATGGHEAIKGAVMDDLELGRAFQKRKLPVRCWGGRRLIAFRMYPDGILELLEGWTKNFGTASQSTHPGIFAMIILWVAGGFSSLIFLLRQIIFYDKPLYLAVAIFFYVAFFGLMTWQARRVGRFRVYAFILYPLHFIFFTVLFLWSLIKTKIFHSVSWRGRKIDV